MINVALILHQKPYVHTPMTNANRYMDVNVPSVSRYDTRLNNVVHGRRERVPAVYVVQDDDVPLYDEPVCELNDATRHTIRLTSSKIWHSGFRLDSFSILIVPCILLICRHVCLGECLFWQDLTACALARILRWCVP